MQFYAPCDAGLSLNKSCSLQCHDHLMDGWRRDLKISLHVGFGGGATINLRISVDEGQILPLPEGELFFTIRMLISVYGGVFLIHQGIQPYGDPDEYTIPR